MTTTTIHSVLVVDDDLSTLKAMRQVLEPSGYEVTAAASGEEAIRLLKQKSVDLVITDLVMPQGDGFELIAALRKDFPTTEIVAVSGGGHVSAENYLMIARGFGVDVVLRKPITRADLVMAVKAVERRALARVSRGPSLN